MSSIEPLFHSAPPRRRGRPPGARTALLAQARSLGIHHFAFLRATLLGLEPRAEFDRYLAWSEATTDLRHVEHRRSELLKEVINAGRRLLAAPEHSGTASDPAAAGGSVSPSSPAAQLGLGELLQARTLEARVPHDLLLAQLPRHLKALSESTQDGRIAQLPSLQAWMQAENMDPDFYSEAEALAEYRAVHGIDNPDEEDAGHAAGTSGSGARPDPVRARVDALNMLQMLLAAQPRAADRLDAWFARPVAVRLRNAGLATIEDLVNMINVYGHRWYNQINGFGRQRAVRVVAWLRLQQEVLQLQVRGEVDEPRQARGLRLGLDPGRLVLPPRFGLVPLEQLALPPALSGRDGIYRSHMPNSLEADDDLQAVTRWLARFERASTARSYRKEVERFVLWCTLEQRKPLSSVSALDCQAYRAFLKAVPPHWVHPVRVARTDPAWRPFRGQPSPASQKQALLIVQALLKGLGDDDAGYLVTNPMRAVMKQFNLPKNKLQVKRGFTEAEWAHVLTCLAEVPHSGLQVRLCCLLELLVTSGIRLDELAKACWADMDRVTLLDQPETWVLTVTGKRNKTRQVPLHDDVVALLEAHGREFAELDQGVKDRGSFPLIRALAPSVEQWSRDEREGQLDQLIKTSLTKQAGPALSADGIYRVIKRFMARAAKSAPAAGLSAERFERASTHWMRHTFVRQALADGADLVVVRDLAGHVNIATTSIYSNQDLARKIEAIRGMKRRTVAASDKS